MTIFFTHSHAHARAVARKEERNETKRRRRRRTHHCAVRTEGEEQGDGGGRRASSRRRQPPTLVRYVSACVSALPSRPFAIPSFPPFLPIPSQPSPKEEAPRDAVSASGPLRLFLPLPVSSASLPSLSFALPKAPCSFSPPKTVSDVVLEERRCPLIALILRFVMALV